MTLDDRQLAIRSVRYRRRIIEIIHHAGAGHTGGSLSCIDVLNVLYNRVLRVWADRPEDPRRDRYIQSKGHSVEALYVVLADKGFYPQHELETLCRYQSHWVGHPTRHVPGVEQNTGALGHGLPIGLGTALAGKMDDADWRVFVLMGDGELAEGSNWEAAMSAAHHKADNLVAIVDRNRLQITGPTRDVCSSEPLEDKWRAFGWETRVVDGHDLAALTRALEARPSEGRPLVVIADTIKGRGVSFMENVGKWHHGVPSDAELAKALAELEAAEAALTSARSDELAMAGGVR